MVVNSERSSRHGAISLLPSSNLASIEHEVTTIGEKGHDIVAAAHLVARRDSHRRSEGMVCRLNLSVPIILKQWEMFYPQKIQCLGRMAQSLEWREKSFFLANGIQTCP